MSNILHKILGLKGEITKFDDESVFYALTVSSENISYLTDLYDEGVIERLLDAKDNVLQLDDLSLYLNSEIVVEFVKSNLERSHFYMTMVEFVRSNRFESPIEFFIVEISASAASIKSNGQLMKYEAVTKLIDNLVLRSKFIANEHVQVLFLAQENVFLEMPVDQVLYEKHLADGDVPLINSYIESMGSYKEKRTIFFKELIDYLKPFPKVDRLSILLKNFGDFSERCNASFEYYLSNFSFNKIQVELDNAVFEQSKAIRNIITDAQSKLVVIPAAFVLSVSQINFTEPMCLKNLLVLVSTFLFAYIISMFVSNQRNALVIVQDNITSYKANYKRSNTNELESAMELENLGSLINKSFTKIDTELMVQFKRIKILCYCNWSIPVLISILIAGIALYNQLKKTPLFLFVC